MKRLLSLKSVNAKISEDKALKDININLDAGKNLLILGDNGAGKTSLVGLIAGFKNPILKSGELSFCGQNIKELTLDERAKLGIHLSYQEPVEIPGLSYKEMLLASALEQNPKLDHMNFTLQIAENLEKLNLNAFMAQKEIACGLSGGEKKKMEALQILMRRPKLAILDEIDSGLDQKSAKLISKRLKELQEETNCSYIIITHNFQILDSLKADKVIILEHGEIIKSGGAEIIQDFKGK